MTTFADGPDAAHQVENPTAISLPRGGGAIRGIGETFQPHLFTGTGVASIPITLSPGRDGFGPEFSLQYSSGKGNGPFGLGWELSVPDVTRKTETGLPRYDDDDVFVLTGVEDLVPKRGHSTNQSEIIQRGAFLVTRYLPRTEGLFARVEQWLHSATGDVHWRATSSDNVTSVYGRTAAARVSDPLDRQRVYRWLLEETFDAKGNHILYEYARDDHSMTLPEIFERRRTYAQLYLRRVYYGNLPMGPGGQDLRYDDGVTRVGFQREGVDHVDQVSTRNRRYCFEVVLDYGDWNSPSQHLDQELLAFGHHPEPPAKGDQEAFADDIPVRNDRFSTFRPGFELRTMRRCQRILMFHHFRELGRPTLVKSTNFRYVQDAETNISFLSSVTVTGYRATADGYVHRSMPPVEFEYSSFCPMEQTFEPLEFASADYPPVSLDNPDTALVDLFGDGLPDIVMSASGQWDYWRNLGNGRFDRRNRLPVGPSQMLSDNQVSLADLAGDGLVDLVVLNDEQSGFYELSGSGGWSAHSFRPLSSVPDRSVASASNRYIDLTGDGRQDILETAQHHFLWYQSLGEQGFGEPSLVPRIRDSDSFPDVRFDDPTSRVRLADMTGDGLTDIVLIHPNRVEYWPNIGYGRFGKKVVMSDAPAFEHNVDPERIHLVDLDGSGAADIVYVAASAIHFWHNQSGNGWGPRRTIHNTPLATDATSIRFADVFGTGTASLIYSQDYEHQSQGNYRVLDFNGRVKPHLLIEMRNNLGASTRIEYDASTAFSREDERLGQPWISHLPFPVHVVSKTETIDHIAHTKLVSRFRYHHGYYDGREREFRGFGRVDRIDTEIHEDFSTTGLHPYNTPIDNASAEYHLPPTETRTWFHTGVSSDVSVGGTAPLSQRDLTQTYGNEYYHGDSQAFSSVAHVVDERDTPHQAYRALRGSVLREEVYSLDASGEQFHPYVVTEHVYAVKRLQAATDSRRAVYLTVPAETLSYHYERQSDDPRVTHDLFVEVDAYSNIRKQITVAYPRRSPIAYEEQRKVQCLFSWRDYINETSRDDSYFAGVPFESREFEVSAAIPGWDGIRRLNAGDFSQKTLDPDDFVDFQSSLNGVEKRLLSWTQTYFRTDDESDLLDAPGDSTHRLPLGQISRLGLPYESYQTALTPGLRLHIFGDNVDDQCRDEGGYVTSSHLDVASTHWPQHQDIDQYWWIPSGKQSFENSTSGYYQPVVSQDAFGNQSTVTRDAYRLLVTEVTTELDNQIEAENDYRILSPLRVSDINRNVTEVLFDALGLVVATAERSATGDGDTLNNSVADLSQSTIEEHLRDPLGTESTDDPPRVISPHDVLQDATMRVIYDLHRFYHSQEPPVTYTMTRETRASELSAGEQTKVRHHFLYSDGFGREVQSKVQTEAGLAPYYESSALAMENGRPKLKHTPHRWVGTGRTVYNNKSLPVKKYEPFFSSTHLFEDEEELVVRGVTSIVHCDPLGRVVQTDYPDGSVSGMHFDSWQEQSWDQNDTVLDSQWYAERIALDPDVDENKPLIRAAELAAKHANTPTITHFDSQGRAFLTIADNKTETHRVHTEFDIQGNDLAITDPRGVVGFEHRFDMADRKLKVDSKDAGVHTSFPDILGQPLYQWDANGNESFIQYDRLRRPEALWVRPSPTSEYVLAEKTIYGEAKAATSPPTNHRGRPWKTYDGAGLVENVAYDFKGNPEQVTRTLVRDAKTQPRWAETVDPADDLFDEQAAEQLLDPDLVFSTNLTYDALSRVVEATTPDGTIQQPRYSEANLLDSITVVRSGTGMEQTFVENVEYNERGQRIRITYGNGVTSTYEYEATTFRLTNIRSTRNTTDNSLLQDLKYTYDPVGNITEVRDGAIKTVYYKNQEIDSTSHYEYDALYRLISASGREHESMSACHYQSGFAKNTETIPFDPQPTANTNALVNYRQNYAYDPSGNLTQIQHLVQLRDGTWQTKWQREQTYHADGQANPLSNRLHTSIADCPHESAFEYPHDGNGNVLSMPHLHAFENGEVRHCLHWNHANRLIHAELNDSGDQAYYQYDSSGQRVRKCVVKSGVTEERIYLGEFEIFRRTSGGSTEFRRDTVHVNDDKQRIALIEEVRSSPAGSPQSSRVRYQLSNHLGSATVEVDDTAEAREISYEEYYPYGGTSFIGHHHGAANKQIASQKRYRYSGNERDDETGLYYYGARYYAPWLGRWISTDPAGLYAGSNGYLFVSSNPESRIDDNGMYDFDASTFEESGLPNDHLGRHLWRTYRGKKNFDVWGQVDSSVVFGGVAESMEGFTYVMEGGWQEWKKSQEEAAINEIEKGNHVRAFLTTVVYTYSPETAGEALVSGINPFGSAPGKTLKPAIEFAKHSRGGQKTVQQMYRVPGNNVDAIEEEIAEQLMAASRSRPATDSVGQELIDNAARTIADRKAVLEFEDADYMYSVRELLGAADNEFALLPINDAGETLLTSAGHEGLHVFFYLRKGKPKGPAPNVSEAVEEYTAHWVENEIYFGLTGRRLWNGPDEIWSHVEKQYGVARPAR